MDEFSLLEFQNDYEFENYLIDNFKWQNWSLLQKYIIKQDHMNIGLYDNKIKEMVAACEISILDDDYIYIHLFQTRDDMEGHGYGKILFKLLEEKYRNSYAGFKLQYKDSALLFWMNLGFEFDDDYNFLVK